MSKSKQEQVTAAVGSLQPKSVFSYGGVNWLVLGRRGGGVLCLAEKILFKKAFDDDNCNNWEDSSLREHLNNDFLELMIGNGATEAAFMPMVVDLTADDGLKDYGTCEDLISLISCQQYRQYRGIIPNVDGYWWTCTAYSTKANAYFYYARNVYSDGTLGGNYAYHGSVGVRPLCTLQSSILVSVINSAEGEEKKIVNETLNGAIAILECFFRENADCQNTVCEKSDSLCEREYALETALIAIEKQMPYKPTKCMVTEGRCKCGVGFMDRLTHYCGNCGQKITWEDNLASKEI